MNYKVLKCLSFFVLFRDDCCGPTMSSSESGLTTRGKRHRRSSARAFVEATQRCAALSSRKQTCFVAIGRSCASFSIASLAAIFGAIWRRAGHATQVGDSGADVHVARRLVVWRATRESAVACRRFTRFRLWFAFEKKKI